jgi:hypothetical protein
MPRTGGAYRPFLNGFVAPVLARSPHMLEPCIENALRSTPAGGRVSVAAAPARLAVEDTRPGIATDGSP